MDTTPEPSSPQPPAALAWADGHVIPAGEATVPLTDEGFLRGDAVFESMLVRGGRTHARERHLARLHRSAAALDLEIDDDRVRQAIAEVLAAWGARDGAVRVIVTRGGTIRALAAAADWPASIALEVVEAPWRTAISGVKTLSYAANQWAVRRARAAGADDALIVDGGDVHELPTGAIVLVHDGRCSTPDPERLPILDSVSVRVLAEVTDVSRTRPTLDDLRTADEALALSATRPCLPVHAIHLGGDEHLTFPAPGPVTTGLQRAVTEHIAATLDPVDAP
ncbi:MAG: aminotransferase class IV [Nitriliruptoraceae bacterium]